MREKVIKFANRFFPSLIKKVKEIRRCHNWEAQQKAYDCCKDVLGHTDFGIDTDLDEAGLSSIGAMLIALMASYITGRGYHHRTCMYEVMAGNRPLRIILSKLLSVALPIVLIVYLAHLIGLGIACTMSIGLPLIKQANIFSVVVASVKNCGQR